MKKLILGITLSLTSLHMFAQMENVRIGFHLSPTLSWLTTNDPEIRKTGSKLGLEAAVMGEYHVSANMAVTSGLGFGFGKGGTLKYDTGGNFFPRSRLSSNLFNEGIKPLPDQVKVKYKLQYIELPVGVKFRTNEKGYFRYFVEAPLFTLGFRTGSRADISGIEIETTNENISPDTRFFNFSVGGGAGLEYSVNETTSAVLGLYFNAGLSDITGNKGFKAIENPNENPFNPDDDYFTEPEDSKARLRSITLRLAMLF